MKKYLLAITSLLLFILPVIGSYIKFDGFPPGYGYFPAQKVVDDPGFNEYYFAFGCCVAFLILLFLFFPRLFGFSRPQITRGKKEKVPYPVWFFPGLIVMLVSWAVMWARLDLGVFISHYTFVPLWWGFVFTVDGIVYKRNEGKSLVSKKPNTLKLLAVVSTFCWFSFEFLNFFVLENWYYPNAEILSPYGNIAWQLMSYSPVLPALFQIYWLLRTFPSLSERYAYGPQIRIGDGWQYLFIIIGCASLILMGYFPFALFWVLWMAYLPLLVPAMNIQRIWNPFTPISQKGDWSYLVLIALAELCNGFFWEFWNFGSEWFYSDAPTNPNYWKYSIPYLDKFYIFSEMPILGYFGYLFFGIGCWVLWCGVSYLVGFNGEIGDEYLTGEPDKL